MQLRTRNGLFSPLYQILLYSSYNLAHSRKVKYITTCYYLLFIPLRVVVPGRVPVINAGRLCVTLPYSGHTKLSSSDLSPQHKQRKQLKISQLWLTFILVWNRDLVLLFEHVSIIYCHCDSLLLLLVSAR